MSYELQLDQKWDKDSLDLDVTYRWHWEVYTKPQYVKVDSGWADTEDEARLKAKQGAKLHYKRESAKKLKEVYDPSADDEHLY